MKHKLLLFFLLTTFNLFSQSKNQSIGFKENKGQIIDQKGKPNNAVKYLLNSGGLNVQLRKNGFSYDVYEVKKHPIKHCENEKKKQHPLSSKDNKELPDYTLEYQFHRIDIDFVNSNPKVELITEEKSLDFDNYYNIPNKPEGIVGVYQYKQITYKNIYPNIDVVFSIPKDTLKTVEYNFVVHPKGKISDIQLKFNGAQTELVNNKIRMSVRFGKMEETLPMSWTEDGELKKEIAVGYTKIKKNVYGFESSENVSDKTVIIDPVPIRLWGTYYGGEKMDNPSSIFIKDGFVYLAGQTYSNNNIASIGAHQTYYSPGVDYDSFFTKLNSDGTRVWGTYYGGTNTDGISQIKVSNNDNIYIAGTSRSITNISTTGSYQPIKSDFFDAFLAKFDTNGIRQWGTYYGGLDNDKFCSIIIDSDEKIYVSGETGSKENISSIGAFQSNFLTTITDPSGGLIYNGLIVKFDANGNRIWGTYYYPGTIFDSKINSNGELFFLGTSLDFSLPKSEWKRKGLLIKLDTNGNKIWDTFFGGNNDDAFIDLGIDGNNNLYCSGHTYSNSGIATTGVFQETYVQNRISTNSGCIFKFNPNGVKIWGSYFFPETLGASVSKSGDIYFTGRVENGFVATPNSYQENPLSNNSGTDSYLVKFNTNGQREWATYYSGEGADNAYITAVDNNSYVYLSGMTSSTTNIATPHTYQPNLYPSPISYQPNTGDAFLVKFKDCFSLTTASSNSPICIGETLELKASGGTNYSWTGPNGFTSTNQNPIITNATANNSGEYSCTITGTGDCDDTKKINVVIGDIETPIPDLATLPTITGDCHTSITTAPTATDACAGAIIATTSSPLSYSLPGMYTIVWDYDDGNGNISHQNQTVTISNQPLPTATSPQSFCIQQNATLNDIAITGQNIKWYDQLTFGTLLSNATHLQNGITYYASQTINGCESERVPVKVNIQNTSAPTRNATQNFCSIQNPTLSSITVAGTDIKWYDSANLGNLLIATTPLSNGKTYYASQTLNNCESSRLGVTVSIVNTPPAPTGNTSQAFCKNENTKLSTIQISGQNIKWYDSNLATTVLPNNTSLENNKTYYASSQTVGCESDRTAVLIQINDTALPTGNNNQQFCIDENATIANLNITGTNLKWYDSAVNGNILQESTLQNGVYYTTQTLNNCESERFAVTVKVQDTQTPIADSPQVFCIQKNALIRDIDIIGQNIKWYDSDTSSISLTESTRLENGITYYASQTTNNCESDRISITIVILNATTADCINLVDELPFPKFFTPNNDGYNDHWTIDFAYLAPNTKIRIFDRYGKLVKELKHNDSWDGTYIGQTLPSTDYWFEVTRANGKVFKGHFSLKR